MTGARDPVVTGIGLVSCLGEGDEAHWAGLAAPGIAVDTETYPPFAIHPAPRLDLDRQIPKRGDQRQMEPWQRLGVYAAGLALDRAGVKGQPELLARMDMTVAAAGGERDGAVDSAILSALPGATNPGALLNAKLSSELRPTLFLAQLSNLLAGNISIVHGVVGSSRTLLGEESAGVDALRLACARIAAGQSEIALVGGAYNAQRPEMLLLYEMGRQLWRAPEPGVPPPPVWERGGVVLASAGAFLVIESRAHAEARGAAPLARVAGVRADRCRRLPGEATVNARAQIDALAAGLAAGLDGVGVISAASGAAGPTTEELAFLTALGRPFRAPGSAIGHPMEAAFPLAVAFAVLALRHGALPPPRGAAEAASGAAAALSGVLVTGWGHWRGEGAALITRA